MKSMRLLERGKRRKAMEVMKVRRNSSYPMGTAKCMGVRRTDRIHNWGNISGHVDDRCGKLMRCIIRNIRYRRGDSETKGGGWCLDIEVGDSLGKRSGRGSIEGIGETGT